LKKKLADYEAVKAQQEKEIKDKRKTDA